VTWVRLDDRFDEHPKIVGAGPIGLAVFVRGLCYCARNLTDGFIPKTVAWKLMYDVDISREAVIDLMIHSKLWERGEDGGFRVHDYLAYNPSRTEVLENREARVEAGRKGGFAKAAKQAASTLLDDGQPCTSSKPLAKVCPVPVPDPVPLPDPDPGPVPLETHSAPKTGAASPEGFEEFWNAYPKSSRHGKAEAIRAWKALRLSPEDVSQVMRSLAAWGRSRAWLKDAGEFIPWPQKFLRKGRWKELPEPESLATDSWEPPEVRAAKGDYSTGLAGLFKPAKEGA